MVKNGKTIISIFLASLLVVSCGAIQKSTVSENTYGVKKMVGIGDIVWSAEMRKSMPNAYGGADIWGRTTTAGRTTVVYAGTKTGIAYFKRNTVHIDSGETTMNRASPIAIPSTQYMDRGSLFIRVEVAKLPQSFVIQGEKVTVLRADTNSADVVISK